MKLKAKKKSRSKSVNLVSKKKKVPKNKKKKRQITSIAGIPLNNHTIQEISGKFNKIKNRLFLPHFLREIKKLKIGGLTGGNRLLLINDGDTCFTEFIKAIKRARFSINLETYIFNSDDIGWKIAKLLVEKAGKGVEVNVIYDAVGCIGTSQSIFTFMQEGGIEIIEYHPFVPWRRFWNLSLRDHRKILVIDGKVAFIGGLNIGLEYAGKKFKGEDWRDTHLKIEGHAVRDIQFFFIENWYRHGGAIINNQIHFPELREMGKKLVLILSSKSRKKIRPIRQSYLSAIRHAKNFIYISNAYFIPDAKIYRALFRAAKRGVDVRILLPQKSDVPIVKYASRYLYKRYFRHGIRVYEYKRSILHSKTAVIDGIWSTVGSSNIDRRSFRKNLEINAIILDQVFGDETEKSFFRDLKHSVEVKPEKWQARSPFRFFVDWFFYKFRNFL